MEGGDAMQTLHATAEVAQDAVGWGGQGDERRSNRPSGMQRPQRCEASA